MCEMRHPMTVLLPRSEDGPDIWQTNTQFSGPVQPQRRFPSQNWRAAASVTISGLVHIFWTWCTCSGWESFPFFGNPRWNSFLRWRLLCSLPRA